MEEYRLHLFSTRIRRHLNHWGTFLEVFRILVQPLWQQHPVVQFYDPSGLLNNQTSTVIKKLKLEKSLEFYLLQTLSAASKVEKLTNPNPL